MIFIAIAIFPLEHQQSKSYKVMSLTSLKEAERQATPKLGELALRKNGAARSKETMVVASSDGSYYWVTRAPIRGDLMVIGTPVKALILEDDRVLAIYSLDGVLLYDGRLSAADRHGFEIFLVILGFLLILTAFIKLDK